MTGSTGGSSDVQVQGTNDSSVASKLSTSAAAYFMDPFLNCFVNRPKRRTALIHRGYHLRAVIVDWAIKRFLDHHWKEGNKCQVISCGAGFDSTYFRLQNEGYIPANCLYIELDFESVTQRKANLITASPVLKDLLGDVERSKFQNVVLQAKKYILGTVDLRDKSSLDDLLTSFVDRSVPTLLLCECVLSYLDSLTQKAFLNWASSQFPLGELVSYEPIEGPDAFGKIMLNHYSSLGSPLLSVASNSQARKQQLLHCGWQNCIVTPANVLFRQIVSAVEFERLEQLEPFDEFEEWELTASHYILTLASNVENVQRPLMHQEESVDKIHDHWTLQGTLPKSCRRFAHSAISLHSKVIVLGGFGPGKNREGHGRRPEVIIMDVSKSDSVTFKEADLQGDAVELDRMHSRAVKLESGCMLLVGGRRAPAKPLLSLTLLHLEDSVINLQRLGPTSSEPAPRWRHSATKIHTPTGEKVIVFGGRSGANSTLADSWVLDPSREFSWTQLDLQDGPPGRHSHAACASRSSLYVSGGLDCSWCILGDIWWLDIINSNWCRLEHDLCPPRFGHQAHFLEDPPRILLVGGVGEGGCSMGISQLDLISGHWTHYPPPPVSESPFLPHGHHSLLINEPEPHVLIVGGGGNCFSFGTHFNSTLATFHFKA